MFGRLKSSVPGGPVVPGSSKFDNGPQSDKNVEDVMMEVVEEDSIASLSSKVSVNQGPSGKAKSKQSSSGKSGQPSDKFSLNSDKTAGSKITTRSGSKLDKKVGKGNSSPGKNSSGPPRIDLKCGDKLHASAIESESVMHTYKELEQHTY